MNFGMRESRVVRFTVFTITMAMICVGCHTSSHRCSNENACGSIVTEMMPSEQGVSASRPYPVFVTPRQIYASKTFEELKTKGIRVLQLGKTYYEPLPVTMLHKPIECRTFVETVAANNGLKLLSVQNGSCLVLYSSAPDNKIEQLAQQLKHADSTIRRDAAWRLGLLSDVRCVPLLISAAQDADSYVVRDAIKSLERLRWDAVLAVDPSSESLLLSEVQRNSYSAICHLHVLGEEKAVPFLEKTFQEGTGLVKDGAIEALCRLTGPRAEALLERCVTSKNDRVRREAAIALSNSDDWALPFLERLQNDSLPLNRSWVASSLLQIGTEKSLALLRKMAIDPDPGVRRYMAFAFGREDKQTLFEKLQLTITDPDPVLRESAANALGEIGGDKALSILEAALMDNEATVRSRVYFAIGEIGKNGNERALTLLENLFLSHDTAIRRTVVSAINGIQDPRALTLMELAVNDPDASVRLSLTESVLGIRGDKASTIIERLLNDPDREVRVNLTDQAQFYREKGLPILSKAIANTDKFVRVKACDKLMFIVDEKAVVIASKAISDPDPEVRKAAAHAFGYIGGMDALQGLERLMADKDATVRCKIPYALAQIGGEKSRTLFKHMLSDSDVDVRKEAAFCDAEWSKEYSWLKAALSSPNRNLRHGATMALNGLSPEQALPLLENALKDEDSEIRTGAVMALSQNKWEGALNLLEKALSDKVESVRNWVVYRLSRFEGERVVDLIEKAVADPSSDIRYQAINTLGNYFNQQGDGATRGLTLLNNALKDPSPSVRQKVCRALSGITGTKALKLLEETLTDSDLQVRLEAVCSMGVIGKAEGGQQALIALKKTLAHADENVRFYSAEALGDMGCPNACAAIIAVLNTEKVSEVREKFIEVLKTKFANSPAAQEALKNLLVLPPASLEKISAPNADKF